MRVNARFDNEAEKQLQFLAQATGMGVSDVLRASVEHYYQAVRARSGTLRHLSAFVGTGDSGQRHISSDYKRMLGDSLSEKHGMQPHTPPNKPYRFTPEPTTYEVHEASSTYDSGTETK